MNDKLKLEHDIKSLDLKQNAIKILINSFYGAFGNRYFYFHNNDIAQSITLQGQDLIKFSIRAVNYYFRERWHLDHELHEKLGVSGYKINKVEQDAAVYTDTDSVYLCFDFAIRSIEGFTINDRDALEFCLAINRHRLKDYFGQAFEKYAAHYNTDNRQNFELENLSRAGIWMAKKKYVLKVSYKDNKHEKLLDKESLIIKGLEAIQASYPIWARKHLQDLYSFILDYGYSLDLENDLIPKLNALREEMDPLSIDEIAFNFSVRVYDEYVKSLNPLVLETGMPIYGRATAYHNHLLIKSGLQKYSPIRSGSKIKFYYTEPNEHEFDIFAYEPGNFPEEYAIAIDRKIQFYRLIVEPINKLLKAMGFTELTESLTRQVSITKVRMKNFTDDDYYPLYVVDSTTLEYIEVPKKFERAIGNPNVDIPKADFNEYISTISKYGLNTVIVPKCELVKYRERTAKKLGIEVADPFLPTAEEMSEKLIELGWIEVASNEWAVADKHAKYVKQGKDVKAIIFDQITAFKRATKPKKEKVVKESVNED